MNLRKVLSYSFWILLSILIGLILSALLVKSIKLAYGYFKDEKIEPAFTSNTIAIGNKLQSVLKSLTFKIDEENIHQIKFEVPQEKKLILADLQKMELSLYDNGELKDKFKILSIGEKGSPWETPSGKYSVLFKEENHFSSIGNVWMPYSIQFFGNFFIHGWPYYPNGSPVTPGFSGGCIRLSTEDAEKIFNFADDSTGVFIKNDADNFFDSLKNKFYFFRSSENKFPNIKADAFLIADLKNGVIINQKDKDKKFPIASITKLVTVLVSLETINQEKTITITRDMLEIGEGDRGDLKPGDKLTAKELIYPLLMESSNDAAVALAEDYGEKNFVRLMNEKVKSIGLQNTFFEEASGISNSNKSTAEDLFRLGRYLYENKRYVLDITKLKTFKNWRNINTFVDNESFIGGKTGYNDEAMQTVAAFFSLPLSEFEKRDIAIILLHTPDWKKDAKSILGWMGTEVFYEDEMTEEKILSREETVGLMKDLENISLLFVGDMMLDRDVFRSVKNNANNDFSFLFKKANFLRNADFTFGNLEGPVSDIGEELGNFYSFRMHPISLLALKEAGFDILSIANNHIGDWGRDAFNDTIARLKKEGIEPVGGGIKREDIINPLILQKEESKIGFLGFSDVGPNWLKISENNGGILIADESMPEIIKEASEQVDALITSFHFGDEYQVKHNQRQEELAHLAIDNGAKIIIGHHPHVIQEIEFYKEGLIAYSLGNFIFDQNFSEETREGLVLEIILSGNGKIKSVNKNIIKINDLYQPELRE
ncbi:MAG: CapA family protein [Patescibacteria group bacterium]